MFFFFKSNFTKVKFYINKVNTFTVTKLRNGFRIVDIYILCTDKEQVLRHRHESGAVGGEILISITEHTKQMQD